MRLRNVKDTDKILDSCSYLIKDYTNLKGKWNEEFQNNNPIYLEIGMGMGDFLYKMALKYPEINFIGMEKQSKVIVRAIKKYPQKLANLRIIRGDALNLKQVFAKEIATIYLNFSDPWPKIRHQNRRLTSAIFLNIYEDLFKNNKRIIMKTDNLTLLASSIVSLSKFGYIINEVNFDLENSDIYNICTEYEMKFRNMGIKINYLEGIKK